MSRRPREETADRLRRGKSHDGSPATLNTIHVRNSANFLSPDTTHGATNLERAPSLNRLHAQSSTETSGLGETVTSGFSSQESVHSYVGDERERGGGAGIWERSRRRGGGGGSPAGGRYVIEHDDLEKDGSHHGHPRSNQYQLIQAPHQQRHLTVPGVGQRVGQSFHNVSPEGYQRGGSDRDSESSQTTSSRRLRPAVRDTGGRSLTPQQARVEFEERLRKQEQQQQQQREREASNYGNKNNLPPEKRRLGSSSNSLDKQRQLRKLGSLERQKGFEDVELTDLQDKQNLSNPVNYSEGEGRRRLRSSSGSRESGAAESKVDEYQRSNSNGKRPDRAFVLVGKSRSSSKESVSNPSVLRSTSKSNSKENVEAPPYVKSNSRDSVFYPESITVLNKENGRSSSELSVRDRERKSSSNTRDQYKSQSSNSRTNSDEYHESSSSKKSFETVRLKSQSLDSRLNSEDEIFQSGSRKPSCDEDPSASVDLSNPKNSDQTRRKRHPSLGESNPETKRRDKKRTDSQEEFRNVSRVSARKGSTEDDRQSRKARRDTYSSGKDSGNGKAVFLVEPKRAYERQSSEPVEVRSVIRSGNDYARSRSVDVYGGNDRREKDKQINPRRRNYQDDPVRDSKGGDSRKDSKVSELRSPEFRGSARPRDVRPRDYQSDIKEYKRGDVRPKDLRNVDERHRENRGDVVRSADIRAQDYQRNRDNRATERQDSRDRRRSGEDYHSKRKQSRGSVETHGDYYVDFVDNRRNPRRRISEDDRFEVYDAESVSSDTYDRKQAMDYDRLFHQASRGVNGIGGGGGGSGGGNVNNRGYPAALDGGYASPPMRRVGGGQYALNNVSGNNHARVPNSRPVEGAVNIPNASGQGPPPTLLSRSAPYTKFQVPSTPLGPIPTVQLTTSPDGQGLKIEHIDKEWERRGSKSSIKSHNSNRSSGKGSSRFLGVSTESAWTKWSRDRRASYRRRIERMEKAEADPSLNKNNESDIARVSTPVKKARQEGLKFVHPDLEGRYLSEDDLNELRRHKQQQFHAMRVIEKNRKNKFRMKTEVKLSAEQWHMLQEFWDHTLFVRARYIGLLFSVVALIIMIVSISNHSWVKHNSWNLTIIEGLWLNCTQPTVIPNSSEECSWTGGRGFEGGLWENCYQNQSDPQAMAMCPDKKPHWQNAVIGLMIFAATFGFLASVLSMCGVCTNPLPRKIYYFHSAGEIFFISALSSSVALLIFPIAIEIDSTISSHRYGIGYGLGWGGAFFFLAAAVCMSLDDLVRESSRAKCCRWCWGKHNDRNDLRQV